MSNASIYSFDGEALQISQTYHLRNGAGKSKHEMKKQKKKNRLFLKAMHVNKQ